MYLTKIPLFIQKLYPNRVWKVPCKEKKIFLTFDDGPNEISTLPILQILHTYNIKATFFCVGENVQLYPAIFKKIIQYGHIVGNHTYHHLNGWKTLNEAYIQDVYKAKQVIPSKLFRPPYGKIKNKQAKILNSEFKIIMFDVIAGDFDQHCSAEKCLLNIKKNSNNGSIILLHDSIKTWFKVKIILPQIIEYFLKNNYTFEIFKN